MSKFTPKDGWNIAEQARIAKESYDARPEWMKRVSHFAGTNNVCATKCDYGEGRRCLKCGRVESH